VRIALVGDENETYPSHRELNAVRGLLGDEVVTEWLATDGQQVRDLTAFDGVWLVPGSPYADDTAAYAAISWTRERNIPFLGTCGGLQYGVIEYVRNVLGTPRASHAESDGVSGSNVVTALACSLQGQQRPVRPVPGTRFAELVGGAVRPGMHYCSYGPDAATPARITAAGMRIEATADDAEAEVIELPANDFYFLTLFQPQIGALAGEPLHPLLGEFVHCARAHAHRTARTA
jgi:CTP synthase (UTP-ammonia lyase)